MNGARGSKQPVLIVEDEADSRESLALLLKHEGYSVATAANGEEALAYLHAGPAPCLILLDMKMPVIDGWEFLRRQQAEEPLARIPVLVISAGMDRPRTAPVRGAVGWFTKPLRIEALLAEIEQWCEPAHAGDERQSQPEPRRPGAEPPGYTYKPR